jgi:2'-5' RNA ligase
MPYAVELFLDEPAEAEIRRFWDHLDGLGLRNEMNAIRARPHVSLGVCEELDVGRFSAVLAKFADQVRTLEFSFASVGAFLTSERVLFLAPVVTPELLALHETFHQMFMQHAGAPWDHYFSPNWVPHCTVAARLPLDEFATAFSACQKLPLPLHGRFEWLGLVQFLPVKELKTLRLKAS